MRPFFHAYETQMRRHKTASFSRFMRMKRTRNADEKRSSCGWRAWGYADEGDCSWGRRETFVLMKGNAGGEDTKRLCEWKEVFYLVKRLENFFQHFKRNVISQIVLRPCILRRTKFTPFPYTVFIVNNNIPVFRKRFCGSLLQDLHNQIFVSLNSSECSWHFDQNASAEWQLNLSASREHVAK